MIQHSILFALVFVLGGCALSRVRNTLDVGAGAESGDIKIGAILPLTGNAVQYGEASQQGIEIALQEINDVGGIHGKEIFVAYEDSAGIGVSGISAYTRLRDIEGIQVFLSTLSNVSLAVGPVAQQDNSIFMVIGSASPSIALSGDFVFRNNIDTAHEARRMAQFARDELGYGRAAMVMVNSDAGRIYSERFAESFESLGGEIVLTDLYESDTADHRTSLAMIKSLNPDVVYFQDRARGEAIVLRQARELGLTVPFLGTFGVESDELLAAAGANLLEGIIYTTSSYDPASADPAVMSFNKKSQERYGRRAEYFSALGYDSMMMLAQAMRACEASEDTRCIRDQLFTMHYDGVTGETSFNEIGDANKPIIFKQVRNGEFVPYEPVNVFDSAP